MENDSLEKGWEDMRIQYMIKIAFHVTEERNNISIDINIAIWGERELSETDMDYHSYLASK